MFWLSYILLAIMLLSLIYGYYTDFYLTQTLIIVNIIIFIIIFVMEFQIPGFIEHVVYENLAGRAIYIADIELLLTRGHSFLSLMFLHASPMHLFGNIIVLFFIGIALEERVGTKWMLIFYLVSGFIATIGQYSLNWLQFLYTGQSVDVLLIFNVGASGAVFGIMGTLVYLYPDDRITMIIPPLLLPNVKVYLAVGAFVMIQTVIALFDPHGNVAHAAHFSGFVGGMILGAYAKKVGVKEKSEEPVRDYSEMKRLVHNKETEEIYEKIVNADERDVKEAWAEHLIEKSKCPECGRELENGKCKCGYDAWED